MTRNPIGIEPGPTGTQCGGCTWRVVAGPGPKVDRCLRFGKQRVSTEWPGCASYTAQLDCLDCGACCREAYHAVEVGPRDAFVRSHPEYITTVDGRLNVARRDGICACLAPAGGEWPCTVYKDRPRTCRDFTRGSANCVDARVRLSITP